MTNSHKGAGDPPARGEQPNKRPAELMTDLATYLTRLDAAQSARELTDIENAYYAMAAEKGWSKSVLRILDERRYQRAVELARKSGALVG